MKFHRILPAIVLWLSCFSIQSQNTNDGISPNILWIVSEDNSPLIGAYGD